MWDPSKWIVISMLLFSSMGFAKPACSEVDASFDFEEIKVSNQSTPECEPVTCLDACIKSGEEPLECPLYCNEQT